MNVSKEAREAYISWSAGLLERDERNIRAGEWDHATGMQVLAKFEAKITQRVRDEALEEAARLADNEICEIFEDSPLMEIEHNVVVKSIAAAIRQMIGGKA